MHPNNEAAATIAARFFEKRSSSGRRISIDEIMAEMTGVADHPATRLSALRLIAERRRTTAATSGLPSEANPVPAVELPRIDGYDVIDIIGRGGMGVVYEAYQQSTGRRVAIKFMLERIAGTEIARRRFEREVELVARLQHPAIVAVLDSGVHLGRPFYAMDFIDGRPLDEAVRPGEADISDTLRLIADVADAADYAHQRGVLHRDLKPSNILIDSAGRPHILDFGLAKAFDADAGSVPRMSLSEPGQLIGTLAYMPPEQARGEVEHLSIRSDVYALGAIAYELITGRLPLEVGGALADALAAISQRDPPRPSSLRRGLSADIDAILLKCLEKPPQKRYATAGDLAADIRRFVEHRPILARRVGKAARALRWVRRNRAVSVVASLSLIIIVAGTTYGFLRVLHERDLANEQRTLAEQREYEARREKGITDVINEFLNIDQFSALAPAGENNGTRGNDVNLREVLDEAARRIDEAAIRHTIGNSYRKLGELASAERQLRRALSLRRRVLGNIHPDTLASMNDLGLVLQHQGRRAEAEDYFRKIAWYRHRVFGDDDPGPLTWMGSMGVVLGDAPLNDFAESVTRDALARDRREFGNDHEYARSLIKNMGFHFRSAGQLAEAEPYYREEVDVSRRLLGDENPDTLTSMNNFGTLLHALGKHSEAEPLMLHTLEKRRRLLGEDHPATLTSIQNLAALLAAQGRADEAEAYQRELLERCRRVVGDDHPETINAIHGLGFLFQRQGRFVDAEPLLRQAVANFRRVLGKEHPATLTAISNLGTVLLAQGNLTEAQTMIREALEMRTAVLGADHADTLESANSLGALLREQRRYSEAQSILLCSEENAARVLAPTHRVRKWLVESLVKLYDAWHAAEPGKGYDQKAAEWRAKLAEIESAMQK